MDLRIYQTLEEEKFWNKVDILSDAECWPWKSNKDTNGYGQAKCEGKYRTSSRAAWIFTYGHIDSDKIHVLHKCDHPYCCNPNHLFLGTHRNNMVDMASKGRTGVKLGESNNKAKLNSEKVLEICKLIDSKEIAMCEIAKIYGVSKMAVYEVNSGKNWNHITNRKKEYHGRSKSTK